MLAFHGLETERQEAIAKMKRHIAADELLQGWGYWIDGKGCMLGCLTEVSENTHTHLEEMYNIPKSIGRLCDGMFEVLPKEEAVQLPLQVLEAIKSGADLTHIASHFVVFVLQDVKQYAKADGVAAIDTCIALYERRINNDEPTAEEWSAARRAADSAADSAAWLKYRDELLRLLQGE
jgi:phosphoribosyl 1,2-cyclic phosphodiesterase